VTALPKPRRLSLFRVIWKVHRWVGLCATLFAISAGVTGVLLLLKKDYAWIQPPTFADPAPSSSSPDHTRLLPIDRVYEILLAAELPEFRSVGDIDRIDFRPGKRVYKVHSKVGHMEAQIGAVSGELLSYEKRWSDWLENLHDGSMFGDLVHGFVMILFGVSLVVLAVSGFYIWLSPRLRRARKRRASERTVG